LLEDPPASMALSPDGRHLALGFQNGGVRIGELTAPARLTAPFEGEQTHHGRRVGCISFSPIDGLYVASGSDDKTIGIWKTSTGDRVGVFHQHSHMLRSVAFSVDEREIIAHSWDRVTRISPLGEASANTDHMQQYVESSSHEDRGSHHAYAAISEDRQFVLCAPTNTAIIWRTKASEIQDEPIFETPGSGKEFVLVSAIAISPNGAYIAVGYDDGVILVYEVRSRLAREYKAKGKEAESRPEAMFKGESKTTTLAFSPDSKRILSGQAMTDNLSCIHVWDIFSKKLVKNWRVGANPSCVAFVPRSDLVVSALELSRGGGLVCTWHLTGD
jgi:WD40 repeat protein